jgi:hypothetical protein
MGTFSLHFVESLLMIGVPREHAQSLAELLERDIDERYSLQAQVLATKRDLADLEIRIMREMAQRNASGHRQGLRARCRIQIRIYQVEPRRTDCRATKSTPKLRRGITIATTSRVTLTANADNRKTTFNARGLR